VASIDRGKVNKNYKINSNNNLRDTRIKIDCFGISEDNSLIKYDITSFIKKGAKKSIVNQNSKILLFDKESQGINNPILEIEENDVKANHGSSIGMIDEETLFYLTSRGIKEEDARMLVSLGKVNYLIQEVRDETLKDDLLKEVLERV
jgi:Fe-S cluster assembly protein SufD